MAKTLHRLTDAFVRTRTAENNGFHADGGGLYLQVSPSGTKSWVFRYTVHGKPRGMGLGGLSLKDARRKADDLRKAVSEGIDPIAERDAQRRKDAIAAQTRITFAEAVNRYLAKHEDKFSNPKHRAQWRATLTNDAKRLGSMDVAHITRAHVLQVLEPIWATKTVTASRLRGRIEKVLSWAASAGYREGDNPARWAGNLDNDLAKPGQLAGRDNQPAVQLADLSAWFKALRTRDGFAGRALEFATLCASRSGEVRGARWAEIDMDAKGGPVWTIPAARMKAKREHRVPLTPEAVALLNALPRIEGSDYLFPSAKGGQLSDMALSAVMRRMHKAETDAGHKGWLDGASGRPAVPHGLRSTFRDWAAETGVARDMAEIALAHNVGSEVERAYRRSDMLARRRALMAAWSAACRGEALGNIVALHGGGAA